VNRVGIVDYGMGNLDSVARAVEECGATPVVSGEPGDFATVSRIILPGVGAFPDAMRALRQRSLDIALGEQVLERHIPLLGICLGMQLLAARGFEMGTTEGLGWIPGEVRRLEPSAQDTRIPHIGWNEVFFESTTRLFRGIAPGRDFYFVHSYHFLPADGATVLARTPYAGGFIAAVQQELIFGVQFHPEKSQRAGFQLLRNFLAV
jgi:imidazole glycerol-phosphate synthase subunit HisH